MCSCCPFQPSGSTVIIFELYFPYAATGAIHKYCKAFYFNATEICAQPVSFPIYKSQFLIMAKFH